MFSERISERLSERLSETGEKLFEIGKKLSLIHTTNGILSSKKMMQINAINQIAKDHKRFLLERSMDGVCFSPEEVSAVSERGFTP